MSSLQEEVDRQLDSQTRENLFVAVAEQTGIRGFNKKKNLKCLSQVRWNFSTGINLRWANDKRASHFLKLPVVKNKNKNPPKCKKIFTFSDAIDHHNSAIFSS